MFLPGIGALQLVLVLPKPSPMLVLDTFLPGIGAQPLTPSPMLVLDTFLPGIGAPRIMRKALDIRSGMIQITMNL